MIELLQIIKNKKCLNKQDETRCNELVNLSFNIDNNEQKTQILKEALFLNPRDGNCLTHLGRILIFNNNKEYEYVGYVLLKYAFDKNFSKPHIPINSQQGRFLSMLCGRYFYSINNYESAINFFKLSNKSTILDDSQKIQLATCLTGYPKSVDDASKTINKINERLDELLEQKSYNLKFTEMNNLKIPNFLFLSIFNLEAYYESDFRSIMNKVYRLYLKIFPEYNYISPMLLKEPNIHKYKIGIISAFLYPKNSVIADFGGVINRLPRDIFDITFIYVKESSIKEEFIYNKEKHLIIDTSKKDWLNISRSIIERMKLDLLFYLDSTMSQNVQILLMSKLARKQAVSHGHPVTSGIDKNIVDYYISWGAAELDYEISKNHYSEELILLDKNCMHQYYEPRINSEGLSVINNKPYLHIKREDFNINKNKNWYLSMQKPFKIHPEFYFFIKEILDKDPNGIIILHKTEMDENQEILNSRLNNLNINLNRVYFINALEHNKLMALYILSDVILDSYYAGGCTTTREALELGAPVVTLPAKYLGGRWSYAYYKIIGVEDLIANDKNDYVNIAVEIGTDKTKRNLIKQKIKDNINKLFYSNEAVNSWVNVLTTIINN